MEARLQKWGNSFGVRIPKVVLKSLDLRENDRLDIIEEDKKIVIIKKENEKVSLKKRIQEYSQKESCDDFSWDEARGNEIW